MDCRQELACESQNKLQGEHVIKLSQIRCKRCHKRHFDCKKSDEERMIVWVSLPVLKFTNITEMRVYQF